MTTKETQCAMILDHLKRYGTIDDNTARNEYGCKRLASRICDLRGLGYEIATVRETAPNRYGKKVSFARYAMRG